ncbi:MAG: rluB [Spirochaetes bacterium]|nr:MAG: rluB [Spirochaetota bacterium]
MSKIRLQAYLASCGLGSRRGCEVLISQGRVKVDGVPAALGQSVQDGQHVELDGKVVKPQEKMRYLLLNKPPGFVSTMADDKNRPIAASLLAATVPERVYNVGRLDQWSSGILFFTNDGSLAKVLIHPSGEVDKEYRVVTDLPIPDNFASAFSKGISVEGKTYKAKEVRRIDEKEAVVVLVEGKNREIRRVLAHFGLRALSLRRVRLGPLVLGDLPEGSYRELTAVEVDSLRRYSSNQGTLV